MVPEPEYVQHLIAYGPTPLWFNQTALAPASLMRDVFACPRVYAWNGRHPDAWDAL